MCHPRAQGDAGDVQPLVATRLERITDLHRATFMTTTASNR